MECLYSTIPMENPDVKQFGHGAFPLSPIPMESSGVKRKALVFFSATLLDHAPPRYRMCPRISTTHSSGGGCLPPGTGVGQQCQVRHSSHLRVVLRRVQLELVRSLGGELVESIFEAENGLCRRRAWIFTCAFLQPAPNSRIHRAVAHPSDLIPILLQGV